MQVPEAETFISDMRSQVQILIESIEKIISKKKWKRVNYLSEDVNKVKGDFYSNATFLKFIKARFFLEVHSVLKGGISKDKIIDVKVQELLKKERKIIEKK